MQRSSGPRKTANLSDSIHHQLNMYALAASAAGVGMLALVPATEAKIVYTPSHIPIKVNDRIVLDLNHDGINDFQFFNYSTYTSGRLRAGLTVSPAQRSNKIWSNRTSLCNYVCASALPKGRKIGPNGKFKHQHLFMAGFGGATKSGNSVSFGPWRNVEQAYLGFKFIIHGKSHFGWARVKMERTQNHAFSAVINGYAYETIPNKPLIAGQTQVHTGNPLHEDTGASLTRPLPNKLRLATLGALALGSPALSIWRKESIVAKQ
jgi:hypothetical protein